MTGSIISDNARSHTTAIISAIILFVTCFLCFFLVMFTTTSALVLLAEVTCQLMELVTTEPVVFFCARLEGSLAVPIMLGLFSSPIAASIFLSSFIKQAEQRSLIWQFRWVAFLILLTIVLWLSFYIVGPRVPHWNPFFALS